MSKLNYSSVVILNLDLALGKQRGQAHLPNHELNRVESKLAAGKPFKLDEPARV